MSSYALAIVVLVFSLASCVFAFAKGGTQERIGAAIILANLLATAANETLLRDQRILLAIDGVTALALLPLTLRYASGWLGAIMLLYGAQFALHAFYFVLERSKDLLHVAINNVNFFAISLCLAGGTALAWRKRARRARVAGSAAARPSAT
ncbi:hypothetical protein [Phenylobacterium sp.]|uniref:hypothetical protein n=1 Tax=Phenylobacterium sp. TaxID=1871053 RepID=UPI0025D1D91F|nr:hypothetical protein [Phenylobacterium sp.]